MTFKKAQNLLSSQEILNRYFTLLGRHGHKQIPNVSVVPQEDSTLLFVNSGMFPLVPYLMGQKHPLGTRLMNVQRSIRFQDMEEVGLDIRHTTAFHMIGNWSLGDYFRKEQLNWIYTFFIEELGLDPNRLYATVYKGDNTVPADNESIEILKQIFNKYGIKAELGQRIFMFGKDSNWWQRGDAVGELGGPDSEIFYYLGNTPPKPGMNPETNEDLFLEIGNSVFMQYIKTTSGWEPLKQKNVDFGGGLERIAMVAQGKTDIFLTDMFYPLIQAIEKLTNKSYQSHKKEFRIIADHMRASVIIGMDGVIPSNKDQGYALRRLLRRMFRFAMQLSSGSGAKQTEQKNIIVNLIEPTINMLSWLYPWWNAKKQVLKEIFIEEENKFINTLKRVLPKVEKLLTKNQDANIQTLAKIAFDLYQSDGYPSEMFYEELERHNIKIPFAEFQNEYSKLLNEHKAISRKGAEKKFKGGLADHSETTIKYHTITHLLQAGLRHVLGSHVRQKGSNVTSERLRFDFSYNEPLTPGQIKQVEKWINNKIRKALPVKQIFLPKEKALKTGALYIQGETYPDTVSIYFIGDSLDNAVSKEFCGGPHVKNTNELKPIEIFKQQSIGKGIRRVYVRFRGQEVASK